MFAALLTPFVFSISIICGHRSARLIGGAEANFWRLTLATFLLGAYAFTFGIGLAGEALPTFLFSGIVGIGIGDMALFFALPRLGSRLSVLLIQCLTPPCGALIEWWWLKTTLSIWQISCGLMVLAGVGLALTSGEHLKLTRRELIDGAALCILSAVAGAYGAVLSRKAYAITHAAGQLLSGPNAAFQRLMGGLLVAGICLLLVKRREFCDQARVFQSFTNGVSRNKWQAVWPWILANGIAGQTIGVSCMQHALETVPTGIVLAIIALTPIVVIPFACVFEQERPTARSLVGGVIAVAGVIGLTLSK